MGKGSMEAQQPPKAEVVATITEEQVVSTLPADAPTTEPAPEQDPENENATKTEEAKDEAATEVKVPAAAMVSAEESGDMPSAGAEPEEKDGNVEKTCGWLC